MLQCKDSCLCKFNKAGIHPVTQNLKFVTCSESFLLIGPLLLSHVTHPKNTRLVSQWQLANQRRAGFLKTRYRTQHVFSQCEQQCCSKVEVVWCVFKHYKASKMRPKWKLGSVYNLSPLTFGCPLLDFKWSATRSAEILHENPLRSATVTRLQKACYISSYTFNTAFISMKTSRSV